MNEHSRPAVSAADQAAPIRDYITAPAGKRGIRSEPLAALDALVARCEQLERERDEWKRKAENEREIADQEAASAWDTRDTLTARAQTAEAKVEQLERERDEALSCLHGLGWMPCADSPYWCFCPQPGSPDEDHLPACMMASALLAKVGDVGDDFDPPTREQLKGVADAQAEAADGR